MQDESRHLLDRTRRGDGAALDALLALHVESLHGYLRLRCGPALREHETSMDLVQSVCREVLAGAAEFEYRGEAAFRNWLFKAAENKVRDRVRYWGRARRDAAREVGVEPSAASALSCYASFCTPSQRATMLEEQLRIERAFDDLDERYRDVILAARVKGMSIEEIAAEIGESPHYTRTLLSRGLARLATLLDRASA